MATVSHRLDNLTVSVASLGKNQVRARLKGFRGRFKMDFTEDYLNKLSLDRLRHILLAAMLTKHKKSH